MLIKTIQIIHSITHKSSGPSYSIRRLCDLLNSHGIPTTLATLDWDDFPEAPGYLKTFDIGYGPKKLGRSPKMKKWLNSQIAAKTVDILHSHSLWMMPNIYPGLVANQYNIPYIVSPRGTFTKYAMSTGSKIKKIFWPLLQKPALKSTSCFHATAFSEYEDIRRLGFKQPVAIIPNGVDIPNYVLKINKDRKTILYLSRVHPEKGTTTLLYAWEKIYKYHKKWDLYIAGPDCNGYLNEVKKIASDLNLQNIYFTGPLHKQEKENIFRRADLFVLPSPSENFGIVVAEALSYGIPVITTTGTPWENLIKENAGWWIDIGTNPLIECMENALSASNEKLREMGINGYNMVKNNYSWNSIINQYAELYEWVKNPSREIPKFIITN